MKIYYNVFLIFIVKLRSSFIIDVLLFWQLKYNQGESNYCIERPLKSRRCRLFCFCYFFIVLYSKFLKSFLLSQLRLSVNPLNFWGKRKQNF